MLTCYTEQTISLYTKYRILASRLHIPSMAWPYHLKQFKWNLFASNLNVLKRQQLQPQWNEEELLISC